MKFLILTLAVACVAADVSHIPSNPEFTAKIVGQKQDSDPSGNYEWAFETDNGIAIGAKGAVINAGKEDASQVAQGQAQWKAPTGEILGFSYIADENGYQPQGDILPTPPPIPEAIIRALQYVRDHPPPPSKE